MTVGELVERLDTLTKLGYISADTELLLFAEDLPSLVAQRDELDININGKYLQLFMRYT